MVKVKKENRHKAMLGAIIGAAAGLASTIISGKQQSEIAKQQMELTKMQNTINNAQNLANSYNTSLAQGQDLFKDLSETNLETNTEFKNIKKYL